MNEISKSLLGAHFSISGGIWRALERANKLGCGTLQLFTKNSRSWKERVIRKDEAKRFRQARKKTGLQKFAAHTSYLINAAASDDVSREKSRRALKNELLRSETLDIPYVIMHPGSHLGKGEAFGMRMITETVLSVFEETPEITPRLLLETTSGQGTSIGHSFEQLAHLLNEIGNPTRIGICLDTCHIFSAGYDIRTEKDYQETFRRFDHVIGLDRLFFIHLNDSKRELGSRVDRHEHIGEGAIGKTAFSCIMNDQRLVHIPKVIETPEKKDGQDWDRVNLEILRNLEKKR